MSQHNLKVESRELRGKEAAKRLRREGKLPAVVYGHGETPVSLTVNAREFNDLVKHHGGHSFLTLQGVGPDVTAIIKSLQRHPVKNSVAAIDFLRVSMNEEITITVPIHLINEPLDVKTGDGVLVQSLHEIEVASKPAALPESITVDISGLVLNGPPIHVRDITLPAGVRALTDGDEGIAVVNPSRSEAEVEADTEVAVEAVAEAPAEAEAEAEAAAE